MEFYQLKNEEKTYTTHFFKTIYYLLKKINDPIKCQEKALFKNSGKKVTVKKNGKDEIEANREIIGTLLALNFEKLINFETALQYSLCPIPLSLAHPHGTRCKMTKSALMKVVKSYKTSTEKDK